MKKPLIYLCIAIVVVFGIYLLINNKSEKAPSLAETNGTGESADHVAQEKAAYKGTTENKQYERYIDYSKAAFDATKNKKRVYFFHAKWCPTCKSANLEFMNNHDKIPTDVMLFKTDYDDEKDLKKQYGVTYQHTFAYVDENRKLIKLWNGGGIAELITNTQ